MQLIWYAVRHIKAICLTVSLLLVFFFQPHENRFLFIDLSLFQPALCTENDRNFMSTGLADLTASELIPSGG
jgi:hypothetical protein